MSPFGRHVRRWRSMRRMSQLDLAIAAGTTARHLSFVETGRSRPGADLILRIADALRVPLPDRNTLFEAAGLPPTYPAHDLGSQALESVDRVLEAVLRGHEPYPAWIVRQPLTFLRANAGAEALFPGLTQLPPDQLIDLWYGPGPFQDQVVNWPDVVQAGLTALRHRRLGHRRRRDHPAAAASRATRHFPPGGARSARRLSTGDLPGIRTRRTDRADHLHRHEVRHRRRDHHVAAPDRAVVPRRRRLGSLLPYMRDHLTSFADRQMEAAWRQAFIQPVDRLGMPSFSHVPLPYLGPIVMLAGIPAYCPGDYFRLLLERQFPASEPDCGRGVAGAVRDPVLRHAPCRATDTSMTVIGSARRAAAAALETGEHRHVVADERAQLPALRPRAPARSLGDRPHPQAGEGKVAIRCLPAATDTSRLRGLGAWVRRGQRRGRHDAARRRRPAVRRVHDGPPGQDSI